MTVAHHTGPAHQAPDLEAALDVLRREGLRATSARRLVLESLFAADVPVSAEQVASGLDGRLPRSDTASVYRNLEILEEFGLVRHLHVGHGPGLYALAQIAEREYLVCESCGALRVVDPAELDAVRDSVRRAFGFEARFTHFPIVGRCVACANPRNGSNGSHLAGTLRRPSSDRVRVTVTE